MLVWLPKAFARNEAVYTQDREGVLPRLLREILQARVMVKKLMSKAKQAKDTRYHQARVRCYVRWLCLCAGCSMHVQWQTSCAIDNSRALALDL